MKNSSWYDQHNALHWGQNTWAYGVNIR